MGMYDSLYVVGREFRTEEFHCRQEEWYFNTETWDVVIHGLDLIRKVSIREFREHIDCIDSVPIVVSDIIAGDEHRLTIYLHLFDEQADSSCSLHIENIVEPTKSFEITMSLQFAVPIINKSNNDLIEWTRKQYDIVLG